jgi:RNA recognition motif-containing protein
MAILNIPYTFPKWKLQRLMENEGYTFNYFHFPRDSRRGRNRGFSFVNFSTPEMAQAFRQKFDNMHLFHAGAEEKPITVVPSSLQGFESNRALHPGAAARALQPKVQTFKPKVQRR